MSRLATSVLALAAALSCTAALTPRAHAEGHSPWPVTRGWTAADEDGFSAFAAAIGRGVAAGRCHKLSECLNDPASNPLLDPSEPPYVLHADCADVPYVLRALYAQRHGLPFSWSAHMRGNGRDSRYLRDARPDGWRDASAYPTTRQLLKRIGGEVNSGHFRTAPDVEGSDFYNVRVERGAIRAGTTYYDPNGHVLVVYQITDSGDVLMFDGHPDGSITHTRLGQQALGGPRQGGGFKNFRPLVLHKGHAVRVPNPLLPDWDRIPQSERRRHLVNGRPAAYVPWVRAQLARQRPTPSATAPRS